VYRALVQPELSPKNNLKKIENKDTAKDNLFAC
jgi:hypothetical protein